MWRGSSLLPGFWRRTAAGIVVPAEPNPPPAGAWVSVGALLAASASEEDPLVYDPNALTSSLSFEEDGRVVAEVNAGVTAGTPASGACAVVPARTVAGAAVVGTAFLRSALRVYRDAYSPTVPVRLGVVLMTTDNPTTARGWGVFMEGSTSPANQRVGLWYANSAGAWSVVRSSAGLNHRAAEGAAIQEVGSFPALKACRLNETTGLSNSGSTTQIATVESPIGSFASGAWFGVVVASAASVTAGTYGGYLLAAVTDPPTNELDGVL